MVYRGGLENRFGVTPNGGSNPSPSARCENDFVNNYIQLMIWVVVIGATFAVLWRKGYLLRLSDYVAETREELKKCTWPSVEELKGSTVVILVSIVLIGLFTVGIDFVISRLLSLVV